MKKLAFVLAVILLAALSQVSHAADLEAGWYANILEVGVYTYYPENSGYSGTYFSGDAIFLTDPGQYGPFTVTDGPNHVGYARHISVPTEANGVTSDQSLILPIGVDLSSPVAYFNIECNTNYDPNIMHLNLWHQYPGYSRCLVWSQTQGGPTYFYGPTTETEYYGGSFFFEVAVVPEPTAALSLLCGLSVLGYYGRRKL